MRRFAVIVLALLSSAVALSACADTHQAAISSGSSPTTPSSAGVFEAPLNESKFSLASPPSSANQTAANVPSEKHQSDSVLEIAPSQLPAAFTPPSEGSNNAAPDAGSAQDYLNQNPAPLDPMPTFAGIDDYMNQQANYEAVGTGLPASVLLPPVGFAPYYYPYFTRIYYPIYTPAPIIVSRPIAPSYVPRPAPLPSVFSRPSPFSHSFGHGFGGRHH